MHIIKVAFECAAFDVSLMRGGVATLVWHLAREYVEQGHRVSIVTPAHGSLDYLRAHYELEELPYADTHVMPLLLDPRIWPDHPTEVALPLTTRAFRLRRDGVDVYFLSDEHLDLLPEQLYPANELEGRDLAYFKPLVFQVDAIRFIQSVFADEPAVIQGYEPYFHYLLPPVLGGKPGRTMVSTIAMNAPINDKVYRPNLERLLRMFATDVDLDRLADPPLDDALSTAMGNHLRRSHRRQEFGPDYTCYFSLIALHTDVIDFLSTGQQHYYSTFRDAPSERSFQQLTVSRIIKETAHKQLVGGCALPNWWLERDPTLVDRRRTLTGLGLDPARPTFYHAARLDPNHKGQVELMEAVDAVLRTDRDVNFIIRCAVNSGGDGKPSGGPARFQEIHDRYPENIALEWQMVDEEVLFDQVAASDFCVFPSKFELDAFLITMGEAMACGAVPLATAQETLSHYHHALDRSHPAATGFAVARSFRANDDHLTRELAAGIRAALDVFRHDRPTYTRLSTNARELARTFRWKECAAQRLTRFAQAAQGVEARHPDELAIEYGWFDRLGDDAWQTHRDRIAGEAMARGDIDVYRRCAPVDASTVNRLFDAAYRRADFDRCARLAELVGEERQRLVRERCVVERTGRGRRVTYHLPHADRVDLVLPYQVAPEAGSGRRYTWPLTPQGGRFVGDLPDGLDVDELVLLLTLATGRVAWDVVPVEIADRRREVG
ncbi:glycogen/starch synthase [Micromonospora schwarzwaldensis]|uniref:glycogen/starch synthase n=1 Tax=Micromonospora sp. DSM 45708 TaxID=3111767 RepID=UPI0031D43923